MKVIEEKKKVLFSWVNSEKDLDPKRFGGSHKSPMNSSIMNGPTLQLLNLEKFDYVHLFYIQEDEQSKNTAHRIEETVRMYGRDFKGNPELSSYPIPVLHPADYHNMWDVIPKTVSSIIEKEYKSKDPKIFFNVSSGSAAMTSTWLLMVGTTEFDADVISPQYDKKKKNVYLHKLDIGAYPHIHKIKDKIQKTQGIIREFKSKQMRDIFGTLQILSSLQDSLKFPILITGETGTGKSTIAKKYHEMKNESEKGDTPFKGVVCGEFQGHDSNIAYSKLFGHKKGAYTGADNDYIGLLKEADGGTVFLDEIGDIPMETQDILLDVIEGRPFRPLKSNDNVTSNFQLICATNKNIDELIANRKLRDDFVRRLQIIQFEIPPLRERREDIEVILEGLIKSSNYKNFEIEDIAKKNLLSHLRKSTLKGNIRDVTTILTRLYIISKEPEVHSITSSEVEKYFKKNPEPTQDDEFAETIRQSLLLWPNTTFAEKGEVWKAAFVGVAVEKLSERPDFTKKGGNLNISKISKMLGIDDKTTKSTLKRLKR